MRHTFLGPTVTRVLHMHSFTPGPGKTESGGTMSGMRREAGQENRCFFFLKKKATKKEREQERERFWPFQAEVILYNFVLKTPKPFFLLISAHIQDTQHSSSE